MEWMQNNWKPIVILISMSLPILLYLFIGSLVKRKNTKLYKENKNG